MKLLALIKPLRDTFIMPQKATDNSAAYDVYAAHIEKISNREYIVYLGFSLELPEEYYLSLKPRSSLTKTDWIVQNSPGVGDPDYRGEYQFRFKALPIGVKDDMLLYPEFPYKVGDRIGQIQIERIYKTEFVVVEELSATVRGEGGFGSTGQ